MAVLEISAHLFICRLGRLQDDICIPLQCSSLPCPGRSLCLPPLLHWHQLGRRGAQQEIQWFGEGSNPGLEGARKGEVVSSTAQMLQELADLGRTLCIHDVFAAVDITDGADQPSTTPSGKLTVC